MIYDELLSIAYSVDMPELKRFMNLRNAVNENIEEMLIGLRIPTQDLI